MTEEPTTPDLEEALRRSAEMSNLEIVRRLYSLGGGRMFSEETEAAIAPQLEGLLDPKFEFIPPRVYPDIEARYLGLDGLRRFQQQMDEVWEDWRFETVRLLDAEEHVVVFISVSGTARVSRAPVTMPIAHVVSLQAGRVTRVRAFLDRDEALKAAGLQG